MKNLQELVKNWDFTKPKRKIQEDTTNQGNIGHVGFGRYADSTGQVTHKTVNGQLVPYQPKHYNVVSDEEADKSRQALSNEDTLSDKQRREHEALLLRKHIDKLGFNDGSIDWKNAKYSTHSNGSVGIHLPGEDPYVIDSHPDFPVGRLATWLAKRGANRVKEIKPLTRQTPEVPADTAEEPQADPLGAAWQDDKPTGNIIKPKVAPIYIPQKHSDQRPIDLIRKKLNTNYNPDEHLEDGSTPLQLAAQEGDVSLVKSLLQKKADPNFKGKGEHEHEPLLSAYRSRNYDVLRSLLSSGANPFIINPETGNQLLDDLKSNEFNTTPSQRAWNKKVIKSVYDTIKHNQELHPNSELQSKINKEGNLGQNLASNPSEIAELPKPVTIPKGV